MELSYKQTVCLDYLEDKHTGEVVFGGGAGGGKSILGCYWLLKNCMRYPGTRWVMGRKVLKVLKETTLNSFFQVCKEQGVKRDMHFKYNEVKGLITFTNGSEIFLKELEFKPSDPDFDDLGSLEITGAFVDECNQIVSKAWKVLKSRIRYMLDKYGLFPKILGSCNPSKNWVFMDFFKPWKDKRLPDDKAFVQSLVDDNPHISVHYRNNLLTLDKASKERLLFGNWEYDEDPNALCDFDAISDAFTCEKSQRTGLKYISTDLAMQGRDRFVAGLWDGMECTVAIDKAKAKGKEIETDIKALMAREGVAHSRTVTDSDGLGAYLESYLTGIKEFHGNAAAVDQLEYANIKSQCGYALADAINKREMKIICTDEQQQRIIEELGVLKSLDADADETRKRIIKKKTMKELLGRSPDYLDMLLMRMYLKIAREPYRIFSS